MVNGLLFVGDTRLFSPASPYGKFPASRNIDEPDGLVQVNSAQRLTPHQDASSKSSESEFLYWGLLYGNEFGVKCAAKFPLIGATTCSLEVSFCRDSKNSDRV